MGMLNVSSLLARGRGMGIISNTILPWGTTYRLSLPMNTGVTLESPFAAKTRIFTLYLHGGAAEQRIHFKVHEFQAGPVVDVDPDTDPIMVADVIDVRVPIDLRDSAGGASVSLISVDANAEIYVVERS